MALIRCPDCGLLVSHTAASCVSCGRAMTVADVPALPVEEVAPTQWSLLREGRRYGPMDAQAMRSFFTSGMVRADDQVAGPGLVGAVPATEAAALLQVAAPSLVPPVVAANGTSTASAPPRSLSIAMTPVEQGPDWRVIALWVVVLFAAQLDLVPRYALGTTSSVGEFVGWALLRYLGIAAACFAGVLVVAWPMFRSMPGVRGTLWAMTLVYGALLGQRALYAEATTAQTPAASVLVAPQAAAPTGTAEAIQAVAPPTEMAVATVAARPDVAGRYGQPAELPAAPGSNRGQRDWQGLAEALTDRSDWTALLALCRQWTAAEPSSAAAWTYLGIAYAEMGDTQPAIDANLRALGVDPNYVTAQYNLGNAYKTLGQHELALRAYRRTLELKPDAVSALNNMAIVLADMDRSDEAIATWLRATQIAPNDARNWSNLAQEHYRQDRYSEAIALFRKAVALDPTDNRAAAGLQNALDMQQLKGG